MKTQKTIKVVGVVLGLCIAHHGVRAEQSRDGDTGAPAIGETRPPRLWETPEDLPDYNEFFTNAALRVDLYHTGGEGGSESFSLDAVIREPLWPGRRTELVDPTGYGQYRFRVYDAATNHLIFSQGYASLFGEWLSTDEAGQMRRNMHESLRFPFPRGAVRVVVDRRRRPRWDMEEVYRLDIDPAHHSVRWERRYDFPVYDVEIGAEPTEALDILILGDGYTAQEMDKFRADVRRIVEGFFDYEPYRSNRQRISFRAVEVESRESGTDEPRKGIWRDTALSTHFNTFDSARYLTTNDNLALREIGALAPYDALLVIVNTSRYGGGGIYNTYSVVPADSEYAEYVAIHEFGHSFGALGDEYHTPGSTNFDEDSFYPRGVEPWEPNITAMLAGRAIPWADLIPEGTPIPTPLMEEYADRVGVFEGAGYRSRGLYRPCYDSIMFHKARLTYCPVSERALTWLIRWTTSGGW